MNESRGPDGSKAPHGSVITAESTTLETPQTKLLVLQSLCRAKGAN